jgi:hypothetical protein
MRTLIVALALTTGAMLTVPQAAFAQKGPKAYCLKDSSGATNCLYNTMAQCKKAMKGKTTHSCVKNPTAG